MTLSPERRNEIAWEYLVFKFKTRGLEKTNFDTPQARKQIADDAAKIGISFTETMEFVHQIVGEVKYCKCR